MFHLPCGCISPEIGKLPCKPVVDLIESQLSVWGLQNGLKVSRETTKLRESADGGMRRKKRASGGTYVTYERGISKGRPDVGVLVELTVLSELCRRINRRQSG